VLGYVWNTILQAFLQGMERTLMSSPSYGFWGLVLVIAWQMIGYMMIIYIAGINNIPMEVKEAARIDGANIWQTLFKITVPMCMPSVTICTFLTLINSFKLFDQNLALTGGAPNYKTEMLALNIFRTFYNRNGWSGPGQAKAVVFFLLVGLIALIQLKLTRSKELSG
jgi:raffinose/stachyose/melibiose transport system permease protein